MIDYLGQERGSAINADKISRTILQLKHIEKSFGGIDALADVSFDLRAGEIHALVGENGAGKSTMIKLVTGAYTPDAGEIWIDGAAYDSMQPAQARDLGIAAVYQEFNLLPELSVAENIFLGKQPVRSNGLINLKSRYAQAYELLERLGVHHQIDLNELVKYLTVGERQIVEIAKALTIDSRILIMDEPSAVLPSRELDRLFAIIRALRDEGHGIIYISHRLNEIFELADRVTVIKDGRHVITENVSETNHKDLVRMMVGRELKDMYPPRDNLPGDPLLEVRNLCIEGTVFDVCFEVRSGEVVGLAGLGGSGRTTVCRAMVGLAEIRAGEVLYLGTPAPKKTDIAADKGLVLIPEDRKSVGLVMNQSMRFNLSLPNLSQFSRKGVINKKIEKDAIQKIIEEVQINPSSPEISTENLSGGNQQKVVIAKWLLANPKLVVFDEPTRGIDVGAKAEIYLRIRELTREGVGVIMASSELPELIGMSDRILVFYEGRMVGEVEHDDFSEEKIMHLATRIETENTPDNMRELIT